jgi:hypothetical protein
MTTILYLHRNTGLGVQKNQTLFGGERVQHGELFIMFRWLEQNTGFHIKAQKQVQLNMNCVIVKY